MNTQWEKIAFKILCWLFVETVFNLIGIDDLIDCSEFALMHNVMFQVHCMSLTAPDNSRMSMKIDNNSA